MLPEEWFETEGKRHFSAFFGMIEAAYREGLARGMRVQKTNAAELMEMYRGRGYGCFKGYREDRERVLEKSMMKGNDQNEHSRMGKTGTGAFGQRG